MGMLPIKSTAATYTERTVRKKSFTFSNFLPNENFKRSPFPPLFLLRLILKSFSSPLISLRSRIQSPPTPLQKGQWGRGGAAMLKLLTGQKGQRHATEIPGSGPSKLDGETFPLRFVI